MTGVDPQACLRDVLTRIVARHPMSELDDPLPSHTGSRPPSAPPPNGQKNTAYCTVWASLAQRTNC
jgi:hypothetical protein